MNQSQINPLLQYMQNEGIKPYSRESRLLDQVGIFWTHLGNIATDKKVPTVDVLLRIEEATDGEVTAAAMLKHYQSIQTQPQKRALVACGGLVTDG